jgi:ABC-2 type transport system permease protein
MTSTWRKYAAFVRVGAARAVAERGEIYGRVLFLPVILGVFSAMWRAVDEGGARTTSAPNALVWYLAVTEWIVLSPPLIYVEIQDEVLRGDIATHLPRPVSYLASVFCQGVGMLCVRALVLGGFALLFASLWTGELPDLQLLASAIPLGFAAALLIVAMYVGLGITAFWFVEVTPLYWVWQKSLFILGGLMLPLELYPAWVQRLGALTPFPALLSGPAGILLHPTGPGYVTGVAARLALWFVLVALATHWLFERALLRLHVNGG